MARKKATAKRTSKKTAGGKRSAKTVKPAARKAKKPAARKAKAAKTRKGKKGTTRPVLSPYVPML